MLDNVRLHSELSQIHRLLNTAGVGRFASSEGLLPAKAIRQSLFADCLRVVYSAIAADDEIGDQEIDSIFDLVFSIARHYADVQPSAYGEFLMIERDGAQAFFAHYAADKGPFGRGADQHWPGLAFCRKAADLGESAPLERYEQMMSWLILEACSIGGVAESDARWRGRVDELHDLRRELARSAKLATPAMDLRIQAFLSPTRVFSSVQQPTSFYDADPFDVESIHSEARQAFERMVEQAVSSELPGSGSRTLMILGEAGTGKTHLLRGFRNYVHDRRQGFVVYAQLYSGSGDYARYLLQHVVDSLARPYVGASGAKSSLFELANGLTRLVSGRLRDQIERLKDEELDASESLADYINRLTNELLRLPELAAFDTNFIRVLLFALHPDPSTTSRVYKYLRCEDMNPDDLRKIGEVKALTGSDHPKRMILDLGRFAFVTQRAAWVLMLDQAEHAGGADAASVEIFRRAISMIQSIVSEGPSLVAVVSCITDLYDSLRLGLAGSTLDRLEKDPPKQVLQVNRSYDEIVEIVGRRLQWMFSKVGAVYRPETPVYPIPEELLRALAQRRTRAILEWCYQFQTQCVAAGRILDVEHESESTETAEVISPMLGEAMGLEQISNAWNDVVHAPGIEVPDEDAEILAIISATARVCAVEQGLKVTISPRRGDTLKVQFSGPEEQHNLALAITNRSYHRGSFNGQLDSLRRSARNAVPVAIRTIAFPRGPVSESAVAGLLKSGGRAVVLDASTLRMLVAFQQFKPSCSSEQFVRWQQRTQPISGLAVVESIFDLDRLTNPVSSPLQPKVEEPEKSAVVRAAPPSTRGSGRISRAAAVPEEKNGKREKPEKSPRKGSGEKQETGSGEAKVESAAASARESSQDALLPALHVGVATGFSQEPRTIELGSMLRHAGILGSTGSGKTTLALNLIEQILERDVGVVLVDRKGDLAGYAKPGWWQKTADPERARRLSERVDVRLFTPGTQGGRPLSISVVPDLDEVPEHERDRMIGYAAQALAAMMKLNGGANGAAQRAILAQAIAVLAGRKGHHSLKAVISLIESRDDALIARAGSYDDRLFKGLLQSLTTVHLEEKDLFDDEAEPLVFDTLLGRKAGGKVPLAIVSTKFLGDDERVQSWVAHLLGCLNRHLSKAPSPKLQMVLMLDEADLFMPAGMSKPPSKEPLQDLLKRGRANGLGVMLATQSPGDLDYRSREQINTWFIGKVSNNSIDKMKPLFEQRPAVAGKVGSLAAGRFVMLHEGNALELERAPSLLYTEPLQQSELMQLAADQLRLHEVSAKAGVTSAKQKSQSLS